jgi:hypothetical protein
MRRYPREPQFFEHVARGLPNWRATRWAISALNRYLARCQSRYYLHIRYRRPKRGVKWYDGLNRKHARAISLYLRERPAWIRWREIWNEREAAYSAHLARSASNELRARLESVGAVVVEVGNPDGPQA